MKEHICSDCHTSFVPQERNWYGDNWDVPLCDNCLMDLMEAESHAYNDIPTVNRLTGKPATDYHTTRRPPRSTEQKR